MNNKIFTGIVLDYYEYSPGCWRENLFGNSLGMPQVCVKLRSAMFAGIISIFAVYSVTIFIIVIAALP